MDRIYITKQKIFKKNGDVFAYELTFRDESRHITKLSDSIKETSRLILSYITNNELDKLLQRDTLAFIDVDEKVLSRGILDVLNNERFVLNILEDIKLTEDVVKNIVQYRKKGFRLSLEHFDSSAKMIIKFKRLFNYIDIIKMDILISEPENMQNVMKKFKGGRIKFLAQNIETKDKYIYCKKLGFDYFQGFYLDKPQTLELLPKKEPTQFTILQLINIIKEDKSNTEKLEFFIKQQPDLSFKLIEFFNKSKQLDVKVESLIQVINLMGRSKLLRWLVVYLYSEVSTNPASKTLLELAIKRAKLMEKEADYKNKDKAYLAGMFSMLDSIFETDIKELMERLEIDEDIKSCVIHQKGIFAGSLLRAKEAEQKYLKKVMLENFERLNTKDIIYTLEDGGIAIDKNDF